MKAKVAWRESVQLPIITFQLNLAGYSTVIVTTLYTISNLVTILLTQVLSYCLFQAAVYFALFQQHLLFFSTGVFWGQAAVNQYATLLFVPREMHTSPHGDAPIGYKLPDIRGIPGRSREKARKLDWKYSVKEGGKYIVEKENEKQLKLQEEE